MQRRKPGAPASRVIRVPFHILHIIKIHIVGFFCSGVRVFLVALKLKLAAPQKDAQGFVRARGKPPGLCWMRRAPRWLSALWAASLLRTALARQGGAMRHLDTRTFG